MRGYRCILGLLAICQAVPLLGDDRDQAAEFRTAKSALMQQLRDRDKTTRVAAAQKLADYPTSEAVKVRLRKSSPARTRISAAPDSRCCQAQRQRRSLQAARE
jgi:hypothetical protein